MKERKQKNPLQGTCPQKNRTESEGYVGGQTYIGITENNLTDNHPLGYGMLEFILSPSNLNAAYRHVKRNKGAGGVDEMKVESLKDYLITQKDELIQIRFAG
jgi:RNA-directed DNA polymerase